MRQSSSALTLLGSVLVAVGLALFVSTGAAAGNAPTVAQLTGQDGATDAQDEFDPTPPFEAFRRNEKIRIEKEIQGAWMLVSYESATELVDPNDFRGFATFVDGYMTLVFEGRELVDTLYGLEEEHTVDADVSRYQIGHGNTLQLASIMGFTNATDDHVLSSTQGRFALQYEISLVDGFLRLSEPGGVVYSFRRQRQSAFPTRAEDALREGRNDYKQDER